MTSEQQHLVAPEKASGERRFSDVPSRTHRFFKYIAMGPALRAIGHLQVYGVENIPHSGGMILASNHRSPIDPLYISLASPRPVYFFAKSEYWGGRGLVGRVKKWFFDNQNQIATDRSGGDAGRTAIDTAAEVIRSGCLWAVFPEGTRTPDGRMYKGHTGIARVAAVTGVPVLPVSITGTDTIDLTSPKFFLPTEVTISFGTPIDPVPAPADGADYDWLRSFTDATMRSLAAFSGQEYVDRYSKDFSVVGGEQR
ncbi:1-acyl-sn-glycerol-3-phosphate acyltransferase [Nocardia sp. BMG51109]|uniref:lysophospholipid acyltransferase family protein n=1 Tax=Nocardia sp. BMG51109 TaxID=1056816 RepID=UPI0004677707|nr:lysophospholipid acyltransferase family protein [Nocardia sp. BMG51109]